LTGARWSAVLIQAALYFLMGALVGLATAPFNDDTRKLFLQSLLHFLVTAAVYGLMFRLFGWARGETAVFLVEMGCLVVIYLTVWLVRWLFWYFEVREIAEKLGIPESRGQGIRWVLWGIAAAVTVVMLLLIIGFVRGRLLPG
ncbi:MAG: DUF3021 domain-containing protein, partial [Firmicutes bacterium]|nr:DUF3021 domain-containing protein [Bacillota bacterium]